MWAKVTGLNDGYFTKFIVLKTWTMTYRLACCKSTLSTDAKEARHIRDFILLLNIMIIRISMMKY